MLFTQNTYISSESNQQEIFITKEKTTIQDTNNNL